MESENIDEVLQEGGQVTSPDGTISGDLRFHNATPSMTLGQATLATRRSNGFMYNFTLPGVGPISDRALLLSDLLCLMPTPPTTSVFTSTRINQIRAIFENIPLAQYKHLPDPAYLPLAPLRSGGNIEESTLETQEVSLPSEPNEEVLPSLDIVEPSSTGGSYKRSSHKKRKSTRIRTKKNKKL